MLKAQSHLFTYQLICVLFENQTLKRNNNITDNIVEGTYTKTKNHREADFCSFPPGLMFVCGAMWRPRNETGTYCTIAVMDEKDF